MRIGYWLSGVSPQSGGIYQYSARLLVEVAYLAERQEIEIVILGEPSALAWAQEHLAATGVASPLLRFRSIEDYPIQIPPPAALLHLIRVRVGRRLGLIAHEVPHAERVADWYRRLKIDLLHVPYQVPLLTDIPVPFPIPLIITMHDVQELHLPEYFEPELRAWRAVNYSRVLSTATTVVVSFEHVKSDLHRYFNLEDDKVVVLPVPVSAIRLAPPDGELEDSIRERYADVGEFLFYPAQTWPHKNHLLLIDALEQLAASRRKPLYLVFSGHLNPSFYPVLARRVERSPQRDLVRFVGMVPEAELSWLYRNCRLVVVPSLYEAGSFPVIEAMSVGAPVICSSVTSLPDTIGDSRFVFDPNDAGLLVELISKMLDNEGFRRDNLENGIRRFRELASSDIGETLLALWSSTAYREPAT